MNKHVKLVAAGYLVIGGMGAIALLFILGVVVIGSTAAAFDDPKAGMILGTIGFIGVMIAAVASIPNILAGLGLLKYRSWARILTIVLSFFMLFAFPIGTALGGYALWVLFQPEVITWFSQGGQPEAARAHS